MSGKIHADNFIRLAAKGLLRCIVLWKRHVLQVYVPSRVYHSRGLVAGIHTRVLEILSCRIL
jgi:hypothetical protein